MSSAAARLSGTCGAPWSRSATGGQAGGADAAGCCGAVPLPAPGPPENPGPCWAVPLPVPGPPDVPENPDGDTGWSGGADIGRPPYGAGGAEIGGTGGAETGGTNGGRFWVSGLAGSCRGIAGPKPLGSLSPLRRWGRSPLKPCGPDGGPS